MSLTILIVLVLVVMFVLYKQSRKAGQSLQNRRDNVIERYSRSVREEVEEKSAQQDNARELHNKRE